MCIFPQICSFVRIENQWFMIMIKIVWDNNNNNWDNTEFSVEHTVKEECKIRTDWIGHLGKSVEQIDPVGL